MKWFTKLTKKPTRQEQHAELLRLAALAYNRAHCYNRWTPRWMCPKCNEIHKPYEVSLFAGPQYEECCGIRKGERDAPECCARTDNLL
jgi:hypothetical protein